MPYIVKQKIEYESYEDEHNIILNIGDGCDRDFVVDFLTNYYWSYEVEPKKRAELFAYPVYNHYFELVPNTANNDALVLEYSPIANLLFWID